VSGDELGQRYTQTVSLSDGSTRTIELTPIFHNGMPVVEFKETGHLSYMGLNGMTTNGTLMVQIRDYEAARAEWNRWTTAASPVLAPNFIQGIEIFNDNRTDMDFVVSVLGADSHSGRRTVPDVIVGRRRADRRTDHGTSSGVRFPAGVQARQRTTRFHHISVPVTNKPQGTRPSITHSHSTGSPKVRPKCSRTSHSVTLSPRASKGPGNAK